MGFHGNTDLSVRSLRTYVRRLPRSAVGVYPRYNEKPPRGTTIRDPTAGVSGRARPGVETKEARRLRGTPRAFSRTTLSTEASRRARRKKLIFRSRGGGLSRIDARDAATRGPERAIPCRPLISAARRCLLCHAIRAEVRSHEGATGGRSRGGGKGRREEAPAVACRRDTWESRHVAAALSHPSCYLLSQRNCPST